MFMSIISPPWHFLPQFIMQQFPLPVSRCVIVIILMLAICYFFLSNIVWISLLSKQITVFHRWISLYLILYPLRGSFHPWVNGKYWFHLSISVPCFVSLLCGPSHWFPVVSEILSDSRVLAYSGIKHTFSHYHKSIISFHSPSPVHSSTACGVSSPCKPCLNLKPSYSQWWERTAHHWQCAVPHLFLYSFP